MAETLESLAQLGAAVRRRRKALGYTQEEVAEFNQVSPRFVGDLERGVAGGTFARVLDVCNSIGLDLLVQERGEVR
ncbi:helix-turn-helix domain-containing protein [Olsenella sp. YH-ols2217]|uniref:Helix-turn-helix domain-containing protein n=1 Tax=Kribbibacterium absianum TaxID=3044210 RepID=A0ABT6ZIF4_9ACTN|nr:MULTISPECIES: helix-turn-helix domain-containing protein [unclassified Olsenella]MDJ1121348.1 helix-turn-helix domain-containing protein [Olsenella sp. YH-ols2216]MDJ1128838.1 helix-turn-helix domain-containing protein [Olsenella sp. YH-ols2217]